MGTVPSGRSAAASGWLQAERKIAVRKTHRHGAGNLGIRTVVANFRNERDGWPRGRLELRTECSYRRNQLGGRTSTRASRRAITALGARPTASLSHNHANVN